VKFDKVNLPDIKKPKRQVFKVFLHCSASDNPKHDNPQTIEKWHIERKFKEMGYHFYINKKGDIFYGRSLENIPAAQKGYNTGSIAICCGGLKTFTKDQQRALRALCLYINHLYKDALTFHGHCEVEPNKTCPVYPYKEWLELDASGRMRLM